jgi:hypothetical protein
MDDNGRNGNVPHIQGSPLMNSPQVFDPVEAQFQSTLLQDLKRTASQQPREEPRGLLQRLFTNLRRRSNANPSPRA